MHQQHQEISATYYEIPGYIREKWAKQQADQDLKSSLDYFNKVMKNPEEYNILFVGPHFANITFDIGRPHITVEELGSYDYWNAQGLSLDEMKYLSWRLKAPMSEQAIAELWDGYDQYYATLKGQDTQVNFKNKRGSAGGLVGPVRSIPQASGTTPPKVSKSPSSPIVPKVKKFVKKYWEESQQMRIVSGGGSHWSNNKTNKTGETASGNGKTANSGGGSTFIWSVWENSELRIGGTWGILKEQIDGLENDKVRKLVFRNYEELKELLADAFLIYEDFKREYMH